MKLQQSTIMIIEFNTIVKREDVIEVYDHIIAESYSCM